MLREAWCKLQLELEWDVKIACKASLHVFPTMGVQEMGRSHKRIDEAHPFYFSNHIYP